MDIYRLLKESDESAKYNWFGWFDPKFRNVFSMLFIQYKIEKRDSITNFSNKSNNPKSLILLYPTKLFVAHRIAVSAPILSFSQSWQRDKAFSLIFHRQNDMYIPLSRIRSLMLGDAIVIKMMRKDTLPLSINAMLIRCITCHHISRADQPSAQHEQPFPISISF